MQPKGKIVKHVVFQVNVWVISLMYYKEEVQAEISVDARTGQVLAD